MIVSHCFFFLKYLGQKIVHSRTDHKVSPIRESEKNLYSYAHVREQGPQVDTIPGLFTRYSLQDCQFQCFPCHHIALRKHKQSWMCQQTQQSS